MSILSGDIRLVASQVMDDVPEGGGAPTATVIADGVSNAIFPDISELDRAVGRVNLRKVFVSVQTDTVDGYMGANVIVADAPDDPNVSVTLISTEDVFDRREAAQARIESYLAVGALNPAYLFGDHISGQRTVTLLQRTEVALPVVGSTLVLRKLEGLAGQTEQYVRITDVSSRVRTFQHSDSISFQRTELTLGISDPLRADYPGFQAQYLDASLSYAGRTKVYDTITADASRYYGVVLLTAAAAIGDFTVQGAGIFTQLVPSAQVETPIADARMNQQTGALVAAGDTIVQTLNSVFTTTQSMFVGGGILPGSLSLERAGVTLIDRGGRLLNQADLSQAGTVDYANGILALATDVFGPGGGNHAVTYTPAATPTVVSQSIGIPITQATQRLTYVLTLDPVLARASLQISYRSGGRWYVLGEDGSGAIKGADSAFGAGNLNYLTGTISVTLGALPDVDTQVIVGWASSGAVPKLSALPQQPATLNARLFAAVQLDRAISPGTLTVSWHDGTARSASDDGSGSLTGDAAGEVLYGAGIVRISPHVLPAAGTAIQIALTDATLTGSQVADFGDGGSDWTFSLAGTSKPSSVEIAVAVQHAVRQYPGTDLVQTRLLRVFDNGAGALVVANLSGNLVVGSIDYATGACTLAKSVAGFKDVQSVWQNRTPINGQTNIMLAGSETRTLTLTVLNGAGAETPSLPAWAWWSGNLGVAAEVRRAGATGSVYTTGFNLTQLVKRGKADRFQLGTDVYVLRASDLQRNPSPTTGEGTPAGGYQVLGSALYGTEGAFALQWNGSVGYVSVTLWTAGATSTVTKVSGAMQPALAGTNSLLIVDQATFRTAVAPLRNGSFSVVGVNKDGTHFTATADTNGVINTASVTGTVGYNPGVVSLRFPNGAIADSLRYNATAFTYLPLDADLLGIDPVRLPSDGKVPIFRAGSVAVLGHTKTTGPVAVSNGQTLDLARVRLSRVRVVGADGLVINTGYGTNLEAGTLTFNDVSGYSQPVTIQDRIEDMVLVRDAQINGQLTFTRPLTHAYPVGSTISSALVAGDLRARVSLLFDQATWDGAWKDAISGNAATGTYNDVLSPVEVTNRGAVTERWLVRFTNTTTFEVIGEHVGVVGTGNTATDFAIDNPATGVPYFALRALGWGGGWSAGNVLRINTVGALYPVWVVRTIQQGPETITHDSYALLIRGDVDRP